MDFPDALPTFSRFRCPACRQRFHAHQLKARCACPACGVALVSNVARAFQEGLALFAAVLLLWLGGRLAAGRTPLDNVSVLVVVLAFYLGHGWYRLRVTISRAAS